MAVRSRELTQVNETAAMGSGGEAHHVLQLTIGWVRVVRLVRRRRAATVACEARASVAWSRSRHSKRRGFSRAVRSNDDD